MEDGWDGFSSVSSARCPDVPAAMMGPEDVRVLDWRFQPMAERGRAFNLGRCLVWGREVGVYSTSRSLLLLSERQRTA